MLGRARICYDTTLKESTCEEYVIQWTRSSSLQHPLLKAIGHALKKAAGSTTRIGTRSTATKKRSLSSSNQREQQDTMRGLSSDAAHEFGALNTLLLVVVLGICIMSAYVIKSNHFYYLPESAAAILVGEFQSCYITLE
jgi:hypothetical protein